MDFKSYRFSFLLPCWTGSVDATPESGWRPEGWPIWTLSKTEQTPASRGVSAAAEKGFIGNKDKLVHLLGTLPRDLQCIQPAGAVGNPIPAFKQRGRAAKKELLPHPGSCQQPCLPPFMESMRGQRREEKTEEESGRGGRVS